MIEKEAGDVVWDKLSAMDCGSAYCRSVCLCSCFES